MRAVTAANGRVVIVRNVETAPLVVRTTWHTLNVVKPADEARAERDLADRADAEDYEWIAGLA